MSSTAETFRTVLNLLAQVPGVRVSGSELVESCARFEVEVAGAPAINALQFLALSANVEIQPWHRNPPPSSVAQQSLVACTLPRDPLECGELQILGIHLVWHLHKNKLIAATAANSLLRSWHAVGVEA